MPTALAASIPGFSASAPTIDGTASVPIPTTGVGAPCASTPSAATSSNNTWMWSLRVPIGLALLGGLLWLLGRGRRRAVETASLRPPDLTRPTVGAPNVNAPDSRVPGAGLRRVPAPEVRAPDISAPRVQAPDARARFTAPTPPKPPAASFTAPNGEPPNVKPPTIPTAPKVETRPPRTDTPPAPPTRHTLAEPIEVEVGEPPPLEINYEGSGTGGVSRSVREQRHRGRPVEPRRQERPGPPTRPQTG